MTDSTCVDCAPDPETAALANSDLNPKTSYDPLDASTFTPPTALPGFSVTIEFCDRVSVFHLTYFWRSL